jgi:hypothetical protein
VARFEARTLLRARANLARFKMRARQWRGGCNDGVRRSALPNDVARFEARTWLRAHPDLARFEI